MVLNYIWIAFFVVAFLVALYKTIFTGDLQIWSEIMNSSFESAATAFEISLGLTGVLTLWLGLMKVGENAGMVNVLSRWLSPLFSRLFPGIPKGHPALGSVFMNMSANMLGLDNAATPLGLKAMREMQELNDKKDTASDSMIMFLIINASGLTLIPISIMTYRASCGAAVPSDVFIPILIATFMSTFIGLLAMCIKQRIKLDKVLGAWALGFITLIGGLMCFFMNLPEEKMQLYSTFLANVLLFGIIITFICMGLFKRINVYDSFIEGAKEGFKTAVTIIPYMVAIIVAIGIFRTSGAMDYVVDGIRWVVAGIGLDTQFVDALPTALMKPLSGGAARGMMIEGMEIFGPDSLVGRMVCTIQGSTDTTFYVLALYFGCVGIKNTRYAVGYALLCDIVGIITGILVAYFFFG